MQYIDTRKRYELKIGLGDEDVILRRRHIPASYAKQNDEILHKIQSDYTSDKDFSKFCFAMLGQICENFNQEKFHDVDVFILKDIIAAFSENDKTVKRPEEKKSA